MLYVKGWGEGIEAKAVGQGRGAGKGQKDGRGKASAVQEMAAKVTLICRPSPGAQTPRRGPFSAPAPRVYPGGRNEPAPPAPGERGRAADSAAAWLGRGRLRAAAQPRRCCPWTCGCRPRAATPGQPPPWRRHLPPCCETASACGLTWAKHKGTSVNLAARPRCEPQQYGLGKGRRGIVLEPARAQW